ncbi:phosphatidylethanolamine-binding protein 4 [Hyperolius riggenbachi]|uniref:phosphatidylethanolamine-binding protein 4 n=1 Tax=Hyperolius riggenbachi TaxID=752182 RepID=UPI0035A32072
MMRVWFLHACLLALAPLLSGSSVADPIIGEDAEFCSEDLKVEYPDIGDVSCCHIPARYHKALVSDWGLPRITYANAKKDQLYVVMIVDPDAPRRNNPKSSCWRHFLATNVWGEDLLTGKIIKTILSEYSRPSPPEGTGDHRYQILVYEQLSGTHPQLSPEAQKSLGKWDPKAFAADNGLVGPVATTQFIAQNPK